MNPSHHPDIEHCRKLRQIGFPLLKSEYCYIEGGFMKSDKITMTVVDSLEVEYCPSVMEMLDVIPNDLGTGKLNDVLKIQNSFNDWSVSMGKSFHTEGTLPNALADLIFWLVENGYLKF